MDWDFLDDILCEGVWWVQVEIVDLGLYLSGDCRFAVILGQLSIPCSSMVNLGERFTLQEVSNKVILNLIFFSFCHRHP